MTPLPVRLRVATGSEPHPTPHATEAGGPASPPQGFRARLGAKLKLVLEWMQERLFFFIRQ